MSSRACHTGHKGVDSVLATVPLKVRRVFLKVEAKGQSYSFYCASVNEEWHVVCENVDGRTLSRTNAGGFTGTMIGPYATSEGLASKAFADFDWFAYRGEVDNR